MAGGAEADALLADGGVRLPGVVGGDQARDVHQEVRRHRFSGKGIGFRLLIHLIIIITE